MQLTADLSKFSPEAGQEASFGESEGPKVSQHDRKGAKEKEEEVLGTCFGSCE